MAKKRVVDEDVRFNLIINGDNAQAQLIKLEKRNRDLAASNKSLAAEKAKLIAAGKTETAEYKNITAEMKRNSAEIKVNRTEMDRLQKQIGVTGLTMAQLSQRASQLRLQMRHMVPGSAQFIKFENELRGINARLQELRLNAVTAEGGLSKLANGFNKYLALGASVIAIGTGVVLSLQKMIDFNAKLSDSQSDVMKTTGMTKKEVDELSKSFGMMKTRTARAELLDLATEAGRLGITGVKNVRDFVEVANQMKVALGDILSDEEIREVGKMVNVYKVGEETGKDFAQAMVALGSSLNEVGATGANTEKFLVNYLKRQAGVAVQAKVSAANNIGYAATFDEIGQTVEVSATAMNKVWMDMFKNTDTYASIAGMTLKDFTELLNTDANEAMIRFLEGLNGNNEGLSIMVEKLSDIEVGGARGAQALSAIAGQTKLLRDRQVTANQALEEATSLSDEYVLKNNNLAGTLDKVRRQLIGTFASPAVIGALSAFMGWFGRLIGAIENVNEEFAEQSKLSFENAKANRRLADESRNLLEEYERLTADGIIPTADEKERLQIITLQLKDRLGESVMAIDKETGAFILNTEAVREQIKLKRLAADEEAATMASRLKGTQEEMKDLEQRKKPIQNEYNLRKKYFEERNADEIKAINSTRSLSANEKQAMIERLEGYKEFGIALSAYKKITTDIEEQEKRRIDLITKLKELNFNENDVNAMFPDAKGPQEGDTQTIDGVTFIFKNGKWEPVVAFTTSTPTGDGSKAKERAEQLKKEMEALLKLQRETENARVALIQDSFEKEMVQNETNHMQKMQDLEAKAKEALEAYDKAILAGDTDLASIYLDQHHELLNQMEVQDLEYQHKKNEILTSGVQAQIDILQQQYAREAQERQIAFNNELVALGDNEKAKEALRKAYDKETLENEKAAAKEIQAAILEILDVEKFKGFDLSLITEEQKQKIIDMLQDIGYSISEVNKLLAAMQNGGGELDVLGLKPTDIDILGFSVGQWKETFENLDTTVGKMEAVLMSVMAMQQAYGMYHNFVSQKENERIRQLERNMERERNRKQDLLDRGYISQKQYDDFIRNQEEMLEAKKEEIAKKQARREKIMALASIATNTAQAIMSIWAQVPKFDFGISAGVLTGIVSALGVAQAAMVLSTKGYEDGYYNKSMLVRREQDGKMFNASYGGPSRSGVVDKPTVFLAGEGGKNFPEMIIDGRTLKHFNPDLKNSLYRELSRVRGFENGYYKPQESTGSSGNDAELKMMLIAALNRNSDVMDRIERNGLEAYVNKDMRNIRDLRREFERLQAIENKAKITT